MIPVAMTIAGSDPGGGAGIQADLKTFHQFGVYGEAVVTLITVQNTLGTERVEVLPADLVFEQIRAVLDDIPPAAVKTGALGSAEVICAVARALDGFKGRLVVDPVLLSKHGARLAPESAWPVMQRELLPSTTLLTPNVPEAEAFTGMRICTVAEMRRAALRLRELGARDVLIKGGHLPGEPVDVLLAGETFHEFPAPRIDTPHTHGTGCTYSAAITAGLAGGLSVCEAVARSKLYIDDAICNAPGLGRGRGPLNHHVPPR
jgi:hydroxymethylpyrimidine kinase/phosphomethylpyrimidine kinase